MSTQADSATQKQAKKFAMEFKKKFEQHVREPRDDTAAELDVIRLQIEALGYSVTALVRLDENGKTKKIQLMVARDDSTTRH